jgi:hypothetical protein
MTDTTDTAALRRRSNNLRTADQTDAFIDLLLDKLEAQRQRADGWERSHHVSYEGQSRIIQNLVEENLALKAKLANPVVLPAGYSTRNGHPFNEGERNVMIPNKHGDWLSRFDVEHAIHVAGFPFTVEGE